MQDDDHTLDSARKHRSEYDEFRRRTGRDYAYLQELHSDSLDGAVTDQKRGMWTPPAIMHCDARMMAYLTEIALQYLAAGAAMQEVRERSRLEGLRDREPSLDHGPWPGQRTL